MFDTLVCLERALTLLRSSYLETPSAEFAIEGLVAGMFPAMSDQIGGLTEGFSANNAFVGFFA